MTIDQSPLTNFSYLWPLMKFVNPAFLFALFAIAIPLIIHLFNFRRYKKVYFSSVKFLKEVKQETQSKSRLKHLLVLCCRILAVSFLALAFAQPYIPAAHSKAVIGQKAVSIFIDNSFSMDAVTKSGSLLDEAKNRAREIIAGYSATDKFQLLTNDFEGRHQRLVSKEEFGQLLDEVKIGPSVKTVSEITSRMFDLLGKSNAVKKKAFIISDFQKSISDLDKIKNDSSIETVMVPVLAQEKNNMFIDSCWFDSPVRQLGQTENVNVRIRNVSDKTVENNSIRLFINGQQKTPASFSIAQMDKRNILLSFASKETGIRQCRIEINDYPVTFDDKFYFSFEVARSIPVLCINAAKGKDTLQGNGRDLKKLFSDSLFRFSVADEGHIDYSSFSSFSLIVLNSVHNISSGLAQELERFTARGGSVLLFPPAQDMDMNSWNNFLATVNADPFTFYDTANTKVDHINFDHYIYTGVFEKKNENIDLPVVLAHYRINKSSRSGEQYIMRMQNGDAFLSQYDHKKGKVYLSAVSLLPDESNFTRHALFVPTLHNIAIYSQQVKPLFYTIGKDEVISVNNTSISGDHVFHVKGDASTGAMNGFDIIPEHRVTDNGVDIFVHSQVNNAGNFKLLLGDSVLSGLSFNYDRKESDLTCLNDKELEQGVSGFPNFTLLQPGNKSLTESLAELDQGKKLWKWCVVLALLFLAAEIALLRLWDTTPKKINA